MNTSEKLSSNKRKERKGGEERKEMREGGKQGGRKQSYFPL